MVSLLDSVEEKQIPCKVPGCKSTWTMSSKEVVDSWRIPNYETPKRMCPHCRETLNESEEIEIKCSTKDCDASIKIDPYQQLVVQNKKRSVSKGRHFCKDCQQLSKEMEDIEVPCRMKVCERSWTWYASSQLYESGKTSEKHPEPRFCDRCLKVFKSLHDEKYDCSVEHCSGHWKLNRMTQLELKLKQKKVPKRKCHDCIDKLKKMDDLERPCASEGCKNTWTWSAYSQLVTQNKQASDSTVQAPERLCSRCFGLSKKLHDKEVGCSKHGCPEKISYPVNLQLNDIIHHKKPKHRHLLCEKCVMLQQKLKEKPMPCSTEGCKHTWNWSAEAQFEQGEYIKGKFQAHTPEHHYCERCHDFMLQHPDTHVPCEQCGTGILWTTRQQLMNELGQWVAPKYCPECIKAIA